MTNSSGSFLEVVIWSTILIAGLLVLFVAVIWIKRWMKAPEISDDPGFTLGDLRQLVREGKMTPEEFERAKARMIAAAKRAEARDAENSN